MKLEGTLGAARPNDGRRPPTAAGRPPTRAECAPGPCVIVKAMEATKLNAQVQLTNLQAMYERGKATSDQRRQLELESRYQDWARLQGRGPHTAGGHGRTRHVGLLAGAVGD